MKCENCSNEHDGSYGSGRFCSSKCAKGFSTKSKRQEINKKVSNKLKNSGNLPIKKICEKCQKEFVVRWKKRNQKFCSLTCSANGRFTDELREHLSLKLSKIRSDGNFHFNSIKNIFIFNNKEIRCDSLKERYSLEGIIKKFDDNIIDINRSEIFIKYQYKDKNKYFNPDFLITLKDNKKILMECKSKISKNKTNKESRPLYFLTIENKKEAMKKYCIDNNFIFCWYDGNYEIF